MKRIIKIIPFLMPVALFAWLFSATDINEAWEAVRNAKAIFILASLLCLMAGILMSAWRWREMLALIGSDTAFSRLLFFYLANFPLAKLAPAYSGDIFRAVISKKEIPMTRGIGVIATEAALDITVLAMLALAGSLIIGLKAVSLVSGIGLILIVISLAVMPAIRSRLPQKWQDKLNDVFAVISLLKKSPARLFEMIALTFAIWSTALIAAKLIFVGLGIGVDMSAVIAIQPIVNFVSLLPITIAGIGTREAAMRYLYMNYAGAGGGLPAAIILSFLAGIVLPLAALPFSFWGYRRASENMINLQK